MTNRGIASFLVENGRFSDCAQANSLNEAKKYIEDSLSSKDFPSFIILDILLGEANGLDFLPFLEDICNKNKVPKPPVLVCSVLEEPFRIQTAIKLGACGYVSKADNEAGLLEAIDTVLRGEVYLSSKHSAKIVKSIGVYGKFTKRELRILELIKENKTNKQIANELSLHIRTVENHVSNIYFKTRAENRAELIKM